MMRGFVILLAASAAMLAGASPAAGQSVRAGIEAWSAGRHAEAVAIWRPLANAGNADAAFNLAQAHKLGRGVPADLGAAHRFFEVAARAGHLEAQTNLGLLLFQNNQRPQALRWLSQAADKGEPRAMLVYGTALFNGEGVRANPVRAYAFVSRSAAQQFAPAQATLAEMDRIMPLAQRRAGVALAQRMVAGPAQAPAPARPRTAGTAPASPRSAAAAPAPAAAPRATMTGSFRIQLGAFREASAARTLYASLAPRLGGATMTLVPSGTMTRLQVGPYPTRAAASAACAALRPQPCFPVAAR